MAQWTTCPRCGQPRAGVQRFCPSCGLDYWQVAADAASASPPAAAPPTPAAPAPAAARRGPSPVAIFLGALVLGALVLVLVLQDTSGPGSGSGDSAGSAALPPRGDIWFGSSFDRDTLEIRGRTNEVGANDPLAMVARLEEPTEGSELVMRIYLDDQLATTTDANAEGGTGDLWGWSIGPLSVPGQWRYEITDIGGNVLASGEITAAE